MRLLVTTFHRALVHGIRDTVLDEGRGPYFGATWSPDRIFVAARNWTGRGEGTLILTYDGKLNQVAEDRLPEVREVHEILWHGGIVYICDTGHDRVLAWDGRETKAVYEATQTMEDHSHVNNIWCDGERFWVSELRARRLRAFDLEWELLETIPVEYEVHNVYEEDGTVYMCASNRGCLACLVSEPIFIDVSSGEYAYARGLARTKSRFYVGLSSVSKHGSRGEGGCCITVLDSGLGKIDEIRFEGTGDLHTIRAMDGIDLAHNRIPCPA